ncbi:MAG: toxin [Tepidisphaeraceae bacterium]|jgi:hypothetical protein
MNLTFVETRVFTARRTRRLDDRSLRRLQNQLLANPEAGRVISGCGLLRKVRFGDPGRGKGTRGGIRVVYMHTPEANRIDLITAYGKDEHDDMSKDELAALCQLARALRADLLTRARK